MKKKKINRAISCCNTPVRKCASFKRFGKNNFMLYDPAEPYRGNFILRKEEFKHILDNPDKFKELLT